MTRWWRLLADAWAVFRRDGDLIVRLAAPFVFLPALALQLLTDPPPALPSGWTGAPMEAWQARVSAWAAENIGWYLAADAIGVFGLAALAILLADPARPTVGEAMRRTAPLYLRFVLAAALVAIPVGLGMWLLVLPGLYVQARLAMTAPLLAADQPLSASRAMAQGWRLGAPIAWPLFGATLALFVIQWAAIIPLAPLDTWLRVPANHNPFVLALVDAGLAAIGAAYQVALLLLGLAALRRVRSGI